jgi:hypothetical protein
MMEWSCAELQTLAAKAASGLGTPPAQALAFGTMVTRYLADGGGEEALMQALQSSATIVAVAHRVEEMVEQASIASEPVTVNEPDAAKRALIISWLAALPCQTEIAVVGHDVTAILSLDSPSTRARPKRVTVSEDLAKTLHDLAARTYVPDSDASRSTGAGAGVMDPD